VNLQTANNPKHCGLESSRSQSFAKAVPSLSNLQALGENDREEALEFLSKRPVHTVVMMSLIEDNGMTSADHRGKFYGYRNSQGALEGIALVGHTTLIEARSDNALKAFAVAAKASETPIHIMMSDGKTVERFWRLYAGANQAPRLVCTELLFELNFPVLVQNCKWDVRPAQPGELEQIAAAHAEVAFIESGVDPLEKDREGFLKRTKRRIEKERTFVVFENGKLVFKADIVAEASDVVYLEGIYVDQEYRGQGVAASCLSKLSVELLARAEHVCLLSNVQFKDAHRSFLKACYKNTDQCQTIFV
jgi:uncharacterized protein